MFKMKSILKQIERELNENKYLSHSKVITIYRFKGQMKLRWEDIDYFGLETYQFIQPLVKLEKKIDGSLYISTMSYEGTQKLKAEGIEYGNPFES